MDLEIREFVNEYSSDINLLQKTQCRPRKNFKIPKYILIRCDYVNLNDLMFIKGIAIYIKNNLNLLPVSAPVLNIVDAEGIKIKLFGSPPFDFFLSALPQWTVCDRHLSRCENAAEFWCQYLSPWWFQSPLSTLELYQT